MAVFNCRVITPQGTITKLKVEEKDKLQCLNKLKRNGMTPIEVKEVLINLPIKSAKNTATIYSRKKRFTINTDKIIDFRKKIYLGELKEFTKSFYLLKKSNFTDSHSLLTLINNTKNENFKTALRDILKNFDDGIPMYKTMLNYPKMFPIIYVNFIKTGELTNTMEDSLKHAITYLEDEEKILDKVNNTLLPNLLMFLGTIIVIFLALVIGVPNVQKMFVANGGVGSLPKTTLLLSIIFTGFVNYWYIFIIIIAIMACVIIRYVNTEDGKADLDNLKYANPIFGRTLYLIDFTRIIKSIYLNLQNKMRIQDALEISKNVTKNARMIGTIEKAINNLYMGKSWLEPFEKDGMLSSISIELLKKGFRNKSLEIIDRTIDYFDKEVENSINDLLKKLMIISYIIIGISLLLFILMVLIPYMQIYLSELLFL